MIVCSDKKIIEVCVPRTGTNSRRDYLGGLDGFGLQPKASSHLTAAEISELIGEEEFRSHYTYSFRRNPLDFMVSWYEHSMKKARANDRPAPKKMQKGFNGWIRRINNIADSSPHLSNHIKYWQDESGEIIVDDILDFDDMKGEFLDVVARHGGDIAGDFKNKSRSPRSKPFMRYYNDTTAEIVRNRFALDAEILGIPDSWEGW